MIGESNMENRELEIKQIQNYLDNRNVGEYERKKQSNLNFWIAGVFVSLIVSSMITSIFPRGLRDILSIAAFIGCIVLIKKKVIPWRTKNFEDKENERLNGLVKRLNDGEIDELFQRDLGDIINKSSLDKLGVDSSELVIEPYFISEGIPPLGYDNSTEEERALQETDKKLGRCPYYVKKYGVDKKLRFGVYNLFIMHFTQEQFLVYVCIYDFCKKVFYNEKTYEYFYNDIVSIDYSTNKEFNIVTKGGTSLKLYLADTEKTNEAIIALRKMIRENKKIKL